MPSFQLFPVSSLLIGSMLADDTADSDSAFIQLERGWVCDPREADCACLFSLLESILCSVREDSCYYNCALFFFLQHSITVLHPHLWKNHFCPGNSVTVGEYFIVLCIPSLKRFIYPPPPPTHPLYCPVSWAPSVQQHLVISSVVT